MGKEANRDNFRPQIMKRDGQKLVRKYWILFFFLILFIFIALFRISLRDIWMTLSSLKIWQLGLITLVYFLISGLLILSRKYLLHALSVGAELKHLVFIHFSTMAAHYSTPAKLGFPLAIYLLKRFDNVPYPTGAAVIIIELVVSIGICGIIALFGSLFYFSFNSRTIIFASFCILMGLFLGLYLVGLFLKQKPGGGRLRRFINECYMAFSRLAPSNSLIFIFIRAFTQVFSAVNLVLLCLFFKSSITLWQAVVATCTAFFIGAMSMVPMGLGVREASMLFYLRHLGIPDDTGLSIVTIQRLLSTGLSFLLGSIIGALLGLKNLRLDYEE